MNTLLLSGRCILICRVTRVKRVILERRMSIDIEKCIGVRFLSRWTIPGVSFKVAHRKPGRFPRTQSSEVSEFMLNDSHDAFSEEHMRRRTAWKNE